MGLEVQNGSMAGGATSDGYFALQYSQNSLECWGNASETTVYVYKLIK